MAEKEGGKFFAGLIEKGKTLEDKSKDQVEKAKGTVTGLKTVAESYWETFGRTIDEQVTAVIHRIGVPTKEEIEKAGREVIGAAEAEIREAGVSDFTSQLVSGDPAHAIVEEAKAYKADLIVMGRRGLDSLTGLLVGSTTTKVAQLAPCAVLTVK